MFHFQINLQIKLTNQTGVDPLEGTVFSNNPGNKLTVLKIPKKNLLSQLLVKLFC